MNVERGETTAPKRDPKKLDQQQGLLIWALL